jgi:hypothetical protein
MNHGSDVNCKIECVRAGTRQRSITRTQPISASYPLIYRPRSCCGTRQEREYHRVASNDRLTASAFPTRTFRSPDYPRNPFQRNTVEGDALGSVRASSTLFDNTNRFALSQEPVNSTLDGSRSFRLLCDAYKAMNLGGAQMSIRVSQRWQMAAIWTKGFLCDQYDRFRWRYADAKVRFALHAPQKPGSGFVFSGFHSHKDDVSTP